MNSRGWNPRIGVSYHAALKGPNKTEDRCTFCSTLVSTSVSVHCIIRDSGLQPLPPFMCNRSVIGGTVAHQPKVPRRTETSVLVIVIVIVIAIESPLWNCPILSRAGVAAIPLFRLCEERR